jgi:hypothetical protein
MTGPGVNSLVFIVLLYGLVVFFLEIPFIDRIYSVEKW